MTRGYSKRERRRSSFQHVRHAEGILFRKKWSWSLRSLRKQSYAFIKQLFLRRGYSESVLTNVPTFVFDSWKNYPVTRNLINWFIYLRYDLSSCMTWSCRKSWLIHIHIYWNWKTEINPTAIKISRVGLRALQYYALDSPLKFNFMA